MELKRAVWYVHINICGGIWSEIGGPFLTKEFAEEHARKTIFDRPWVVTPDYEKRGV